MLAAGPPAGGASCLNQTSICSTALENFGVLTFTLPRASIRSG
jgi:hypothetical protein